MVIAKIIFFICVGLLLSLIHIYTIFFCHHHTSISLWNMEVKIFPPPLTTIFVYRKLPQLISLIATVIIDVYKRQFQDTLFIKIKHYSC